MGLDKAAQEHPWIPAQLEQQLEQGQSTGGPWGPSLPSPFVTHREHRGFSPFTSRGKNTELHWTSFHGGRGAAPPPALALGTGDRGDTALGDTPRDTPSAGDTSGIHSQ